MLPVKEVQMTGNNPVVKEDKDDDVLLQCLILGKFLPEIWMIDMIHSPLNGMGNAWDGEFLVADEAFWGAILMARNDT